MRAFLLIAVLLAGIAAALLTGLIGNMWASYGVALFLAVPFCIGAITGVAVNYREQRSLQSTLGCALSTTAVPSACVLLWRIEGLLCILMGSPLIVPLVLAGAASGRAAARADTAGRTSVTLFLLVPFLPPGLATVERLPAAPFTSVTTSIEIDAPPHRVWPNVIAFPEIGAPSEWWFRRGIAYPTRARMENGIRYCDFSTGAFVEPVEVADAPRLLRFSVVSSPPPMREWNPFGQTHPPHLSGFLVSRRGEFRLVPLPGGRTRLEGTTIYQQNLWPGFYWRLYSDAIIHRIHSRVLGHIRRLSEAADGAIS